MPATARVIRAVRSKVEESLNVVTAAELTDDDDDDEGVSNHQMKVEIPIIQKSPRIVRAVRLNVEQTSLELKKDSNVVEEEEPVQLIYTRDSNTTKSLNLMRLNMDKLPLPPIDGVKVNETIAFKVKPSWRKLRDVFV